MGRSNATSAQLIAIALFALATGCAKKEAALPQKDLVVIGQITSAISLDPYLHNEESTYSTLAHFYESLVAFGPNMELQPQLATEWENVSDTVLRFSLRRNVMFHDGRPCEAADVVASLQRARDLPGSRVNHYLASVSQLRVVDANIVEVETTTPAPLLLNLLAFISILPRDTPLQPLTRPVGTGPYRYVSGKAGGVIEGEKFDRYWGNEPVFRSVRIVPLPDPKQRAEAVAAGKAHVVSRYPEDYWNWGLKQKGMRLVSRSGPGVIMMGISVRAGSPFADIRLRRALSMALDRDRIAGSGDQPLAVAMHQIVPPSVFGFDLNMETLVYDPQAARNLVSQAAPGGVECEILMPESLRGVGAQVSEQLRSVGIVPRPVILPWEEFNARWFEAKASLSLFAWSSGSGDASEVLGALAHTPRESYGGNNLFGYSNPKLDALIEESDRSTRPQKRREILNQAMRILREDLPVIPIIQRYHLFAVRPDVQWAPRPDRRVCAFNMK